jgi:hypothetical protein
MFNEVARNARLDDVAVAKIRLKVRTRYEAEPEPSE